MAGLIGHGDAFVLRDPAGIRPVYYYTDDEIVVVASERTVIQPVFNMAFLEKTVFKITGGIKNDDGALMFIQNVDKAGWANFNSDRERDFISQNQLSL